jgi:hypothetical protein
MREANKRGAGGGAGVAARILLDPDPVLVGKHRANIEFLVAECIDISRRER